MPSNPTIRLEYTVLGHDVTVTVGKETVSLPNPMLTVENGLAVALSQIKVQVVDSYGEVTEKFLGDWVQDPDFIRANAYIQDWLQLHESKIL